MDIQFNTTIAAPVAEVFAAVTSKIGYQGWWTDTCDVNAEIGGVSSIRFEKESGTEEMIFQTLENIPDQQFTWLCTANNVFKSWVDTTLTYELSTDGDHTQLVFCQKSKSANWDKHPDYRPSTDGWEFFMESLKSYCETGDGEPWSSM